MAELGKRAHEYALCVVALTDSLIREGVPPDVARSEARYAAAMVFSAETPIERSDPPCPVCGR